MSQIKNIPMADIVVSDNNPRKTFDENYIQELAESIKENGLIQAIVVRKVGKKPNLKYELVCGECRYRACQLIGAETIKAEVTDLEDKKAFEFMILENLQRKDIKPLEESAAINRLYTEGGYKIKEISKMLGKSDSFVISRIQLTNIIPQFAELMDAGTLFLIHLQDICKLSTENQEILYNTCFTPECVAQWDFKILSMDKLHDWIDEHIMCSLAKARFNLSDVTYTACGSCEGCPFNTATDASNYKEANRPRCMNREKFTAKNREALFRMAKTAGLPVIVAGTTDKSILNFASEFGLKVEQLGKREYVVEPVAPSESTFKDKETYQMRMINFEKVKAVFDSNVADGSVIKVFELANGNKFTGEVKFLYNVPVSEYDTQYGATTKILNDITNLKTKLEDIKAERVSDEVEEQRKFFSTSQYSTLNTDLTDNERNVFLAILLMRFGFDFKTSLGIDTSTTANVIESFPILKKNFPAIVREFIRTTLSEQSVNFSKDLASLLAVVMNERFEPQASEISAKLDTSYKAQVESIEKLIEEQREKIVPEETAQESSEEIIPCQVSASDEAEETAQSDQSETEVAENTEEAQEASEAPEPEAPETERAEETQVTE